jgi:hypothetical protein
VEDEVAVFTGIDQCFGFRAKTHDSIASWTFDLIFDDFGRYSSIFQFTHCSHEASSNRHVIIQLALWGEGEGPHSLARGMPPPKKSY